MREIYKDNLNLVLLFITVWIVFSLLSFGYAFTYFRTEYSDFKDHKKVYWGDLLVCMLMGLAGPVSLVIAWCLGYTKYSINLKTLSREYKDEAR